MVRACPSGGADALQEDEAAYVVDEVGHTDLHLGTLDTNRADEEVHAGLLIGEHMLHTRADHRLAGIGASG